MVALFPSSDRRLPQGTPGVCQHPSYQDMGALVVFNVSWNGTNDNDWLVKRC
jgi:hypothetical protein